MRALTIFVVAALSLPALAQQPTPSFEILDAKITSAIANKEAADNKTSFTTGEQAYLWMKVKPAAENAQLRIKWSVDGAHVWTMDPVPARLGRLWYYKTLHVPGSWKAEIVDASDAVVKDVTFTVTGAPVQPAAAETTATAAPGESSHFAVVDLQLAEEIKDRNAFNPATNFTKGAKVYAWMKLNVKDPETQLKLRWLLGEKPVYTSSAVTVKQSPGWRTWLYKTVDDSGAWKVEVLDAEDKIVHSASFNVN